MKRFLKFAVFFLIIFGTTVFGIGGLGADRARANVLVAGLSSLKTIPNPGANTKSYYAPWYFKWIFLGVTGLSDSYGRGYDGFGTGFDLGGQWGKHRVFGTFTFYFGSLNYTKPPPAPGEHEDVGDGFFGAMLNLNYGYEFVLNEETRVVASIGTGIPYLIARADFEFGPPTYGFAYGVSLGAYLDEVWKPRLMLGGFFAWRY